MVVRRRGSSRGLRRTPTPDSMRRSKPRAGSRPVPESTEESDPIARAPRRIHLPAAVLLGLGLLSSASPSPSAVARPHAEPAVAVVAGAYLGAYVQPDGWSKAEVKEAITRLESNLGRRLDVSHLFYAWDGNFPNWKERWDLRKGRIPMISWRGTSLDAVLDGSHDELIRSRADRLGNLDGPVLLRWFAEMDAVVWEREIGSPERFIRAWRYVHALVAERGATNVEWVWCPNAYAFDTGEAESFYPGDAYVDWICADGYNWAPERDGAAWASFESIFSSFYAWAAERGKPLMVGETGVLERDPREKAAWLSAIGATLETSYPAIEALVYFDSEATSNQGGWFDWRVDTSGSSFEAFKSLAAAAYFNVR